MATHCERSREAQPTNDTNDPSEDKTSIGVHSWKQALSSEQKHTMQSEKSKLLSFAVPELNQRRIWFAMVVAAAVDAVQLSLGPAGMFWVDQILDVIAMILISAAIGFHPLLLPTFVLEFLPVADLLPSWTACTAAVVLLRKKFQVAPSPPPVSSAPPSEPPPIEVSAEVTRVPPKL